MQSHTETKHQTFPPFTDTLQLFPCSFFFLLYFFLLSNDHIPTHYMFYLFILFILCVSRQKVTFTPTGILSVLFWFVFGHGMWHGGSQFPDQGSNPCPLQWKYRVLTTGLPGDPQCLEQKYLQNDGYHQFSSWTESESEVNVQKQLQK